LSLKNSIYLVVFLLGLSFQQGYAQNFEQIGGTINAYSAITTILSDDDNNVDSVIVVDGSKFTADDTVMIYCVKGSAIGDGGLYPAGEDAQQPRNTGKYAFLLVESVVNVNTVILNATVNPEIRPMGPGEMAQLIRVPSYKNAEVTSELTTDPWNPATGEGGVVSMFVSGILRLTDDIDVSGDGLWGARISSDPYIYGGDCSSVNTTMYDSAFYQFDNPRSGFKGEGITDTTFHGLLGMRGKAPSINGGGGGNALFAGGGGGSNYFSGITGGNESTACGLGVAETGGKGGDRLSRDYYKNGNPSNNGNRIFFGGGGGGGVRMIGFNSTNGGDGGGIVVIVADSIEGNGGSILANGGDVTGLATGAAGGGGGGGCVILDVNGYKGTVTISAVGGDGGNTTGSDTLGMGGAGGGGIYWLAGAGHTEISPNFASGTNGVHINLPFPPYDPLAAPSTPHQLNGLIAPLRGFLFNPVPNEFTVCSDQDPDPIVASVPKGGDNTYTYQWVDSSSTQNFWADIAGATSKDYDPPILSDTTYFRRVVSSVGLVDTSFRIAIYVHPAITDNTISAPDTVCSGLAPGIFQSSQMVDGPPWIAGGPTGGTFQFKWQHMEDGAGSYSDLTGIVDDSTYQAGGLTITTDFRRIAFAGVCRDTSSALRVRVLETLAGNDITPLSETVPYDTICFNTAPELISGPVPSGGEAADIRYQWLSSDNPLVMGTLVGGETGQTFQSAALTQTTYFRRIVLSGNDDACRDTSAFVEVLNIPYIDAGSNVISADQVVCQGINAAALNGSTPTGAYTGSYTFSWLSSTDMSTWAPASGDPTVETGYDPGIMAGPDTWYRRMVGWGAQELVCKDTSAFIAIDVLDSITNNQIPSLDSLCQGLMPVNILGQTTGGETTSRTYDWYMVQRNTAPGDGEWGTAVASGPAERDYLDPSQLSTDTDRWYRRIVTSGPGGECLDTSNMFHLEVHSAITGNAIDTDQKICYNDTRALRGFAPTGGESGVPRDYTWRTWQQGQDSTDAVIIPSSDQEAYDATFNNPGVLTQYFDRVLEVGACRDTSNHLQVDVMQLPGGRLTTPDFDSCSNYQVDLDILTNLNAGNPGYPAEAGSYNWTVTLKHAAATGIGPFTLNSASLADPSDVLLNVMLDDGGASYVGRVYEIESISYLAEAAYACVAPPANIVGGPVNIGVYHTPVPVIQYNQAPRESVRVCNSVLTLDINDPDNGIGSWTFNPDQNISEQESSPGIYDVSINASIKSAYTVVGEDPYQAIYRSQADATGCIGYDTVDLYFYEEPAAAYAGPDTLVYVINALQLNADPPTAGWGLWELTSGEGEFDDDTLYNTIVRGMEDGENSFTWTVANGEGEGLCSSTSDVAIVIRSDVNRYNGFSPNGDMNNEYFIMQGLIYAEDFTFRVFSALGNTVRTVTKQDAENMVVDESMIRDGLREDEMVVWDGRSDNGTLVPAGTYYFVISFYYADETYEFKDYVVVAYD